ncbi:MAG: SusC/RagA family TonB-linked outer membrane protein, partial [Bacteroidales bacterium]|nr:SusC/RagA family TonB-linked outer membrane protein [Bacteroidales bacterium]
FIFTFNSSMVEAYTNLDVEAEGKLEDVLKEILKDTDLDFKVKNGIYVINKKAPVIETQQIEKINITGTVKDENGEPLPGVAVMIKGTNIGTATGMNGEFSLQFLESFPNPLLYITMLGFESVSKPIGNQRVFDITLIEAIAGLDEVVVTGYTKTSKVRATSASAKIKSENVERQVTTNLDSRMEGLATGLNINAVTNDGGQESLEFILRGTSTFDYNPDESSVNDPIFQQINSQNRQPLIVVDGFPYDGPFNDIDQATIESIDVLKDAAATALWGLRASNGVIVITTKRGQEGAPRVTFSTNWTFGTRMDLNDLGLASAIDQIRVLNNNQIVNPESTYAWGAINYTDNGVPNYGEKYRHLNAFDEIWADYYANSITESERDNQLNLLGQNNVLPEFEEQFTRPSFASQNSLSINGGSKFINYNFTSSYVSEKKALKGDDYERLNLALMTDIKVTDKLKTTFDISVANSKQKDNGLGISSLYNGFYNISQFDQLVDAQGNPMAIKDTYSGNKEEFLGLGFDDVAYNPVLDQKYNDNRLSISNIRLAAGITYDITSWFSADVKYQYNVIDNEYRKHLPLGLTTMKATMNSFVMVPDSGDGSGANRAVPYGNWLEMQTTKNEYTVARGNLNFNKVIANNHVVNALLGMEATESEATSRQDRYVGYSDVTGLYDRNFNHSRWADNNNMVQEDIDNSGILVDPYLGMISYKNINNYRVPVISRTTASFANMGYSYKAKYNIEGSLKLARGTAFGINKRLATNVYWAVSGSWNAAKEQFLDYDWLNVLKVRASFGVNGNMRQGLTTQTVIQYSDFSDWISGAQYAYILSSANPNLKPEQTNTFNIGIDFGFFKRLNGTIDLYNKQSVDLLVPQLVNPTYALTPVFVNEGEINNKGIEINIGGDVIRKSDFTWNANLNLTYNKNEVIKYSDRPELNAQDFYIKTKEGTVKIIGEDISSQARYKYAGLDTNGNPQVYNRDGDVISYNDPSFGLLNEHDLVTTKPFISPYFGGLTNTFSYKQFTLSTLMTFKFGHVFQENLQAKYGRYSGSDDTKAKHKDIARVWQNPGDENTTDLPALPRNTEELSDYRYSAFVFSDYGIHDASHIRFKDITLQYDLNPDLLSKLGIARANLLFQVRDLGLVWKANDVDVDPESVPFSGRDISFGSTISRAYRPGIKMPVSFVLGAKFEF